MRLDTQLWQLYPMSKASQEVLPAEPTALPVAIPPQASRDTAMPAVSQRHFHSQHDLLLHHDEQWGVPDFGFELISIPTGLQVTVLNYGERQPAAENVLLKFNRPILGHEQLRTTNGDASFSESGKLLLLQTPFLLIVVDAATQQTWHFALPNRTMLTNSHWTGDQLRARLLAYGKPTGGEQTLGPWTWEEICRHWQPGLGRAV
jgi:hypothetical protein